MYYYQTVVYRTHCVPVKTNFCVKFLSTNKEMNLLNVSVLNRIFQTALRASAVNVIRSSSKKCFYQWRRGFD